jgi:hypothetical protein
MDTDVAELFERSLRHATEHHTGAALDAALEELGWSEALEAEPRAAVAGLFEAQGATTATSGALDQLLAAALVGPLPASVPGAAASVVLPPIDRWDAPGVVDGARLRVEGLALAGIAHADHALVAISAAPGLIRLPVADLDLRPITGLDPDLGLVAVTARVDLDDLTSDPSTAAEPATGDWDTAVARGQLALAHELVGVSRTMLELARTHALDRVQFDRPISSFQAVRHRLAEALVAIETADAMVDGAWTAGAWNDGARTAGADRDAALTAAMAKAVAGRAARVTARHAQQVLAGIGFTTEHPFHRSLRRVLVLDGLLGTTATLTRALGTDVADRRALPALPPL